MAHDVDKVLQECVETEGDMTKDAATDFLKKLRQKGRYSCDVWS